MSRDLALEHGVRTPKVPAAARWPDAGERYSPTRVRLGPTFPRLMRRWEPEDDSRREQSNCKNRDPGQAEGAPMRRKLLASASHRRSVFQPAVQPGKGFFLHFPVELMRSVVEARPVPVRCAGFLVHFREDPVRSFHLRHSE